MVMTSQQISQMASSQTAMFGQFQSYAQQITPPYGSSPGMGYGANPTGYMSGPTPAPPPMPSWTPNAPNYGGGLLNMAGQMPYAQPGSGYAGAMGGRVMGAGLGAASAGISGLGTAVGIGGLIGMGGSALGIGGAGMATLGALGGPLGMGIAGGLAAGGYGATQMMEGHQQRQAVNQVLQNRFGGATGVGGGRGGQGFSSREMGGISTMVREMGTEDMFSSMEELTRVMDNTAQMGVYKGVQSARQFRQKFKQTVDSLKEIAQTMNTTLEGASELMQQSRGMGFFSGQDISRNLMQTRMGAASSGMSVGQIQQIGQMGSQMGMSMGWRGRTGAGAAQNIATNVGTAVRSGALSEEQLFEATGGLTGAEGVQALTSRMMQASNRFMSKGAGRVMTAAMWDPSTGGINRDVMQQVKNGEVSFQEARRIARGNIRSSGMNRSEFFANSDRIRGQAIEEGGFDMQVGMLEGHLRRKGIRGLEDPRAERFMRRRLGYSQPEIEAIGQMRREMPRIMGERRSAMRQEVTNMTQSRRREGSGLQGMRRRWSQWWQKSVDDPIRQAADDLQTSITEGIEGMMGDLEGRIQTSLSSQTQSMVRQWARTGDRPTGMMSASELTSFAGEARQRGGEFEAGGGGFMADLGRAMGTRGPGQIQQLRSAKAYAHGLPANASSEERAKFLQNMQRDLSISHSDMGYTNSDMKDLGSKALDEVYGAMTDVQRSQWVNNRSNKDKAMGMAKAQINLLKKSEWGREYFSKAKTQYQQYAALANLQEAGGFGVLGIDTSALPGGGGDQDFFQTIEGARAMQEDAISKIVSASGRGRTDTKWGRAGWGEKLTRGALGVASLGVSELFGEDSLGASVSGLFGRAGKVGGGIDNASATRLLKNTELREDLRIAQSGGPGAKAARQRLTRASLGDSTSTYGESAEDRNEMQTLLNMATKGAQSDKDLVGTYLEAAAGEQGLILKAGLQKSAAKLSRFTSRNAETLREGMGQEAYDQYQRVLQAQESGDHGEALREERIFYQKYGGSKEGNFLLSHLRKGGVGEGLQEGLSTLADYTRHFRSRSKKQKARDLIELTLGSAGIRDEKTLTKLLGGRRGTSKFMREVGKGGDAEEMARRLVGQLDDPQIEGLADRGMSQEDLIEQLTEQISRGEGGVSGEELRKSMTGQASSSAWDARVSAAPKETVDTAAESLTELRKSNLYLKLLIQEQVGADGLKQLIEAAQKGAKNDKEGEGGK